MLNALCAGAFYFFTIFVVGFCLGTIRVFLLTPHFGDTAAVIIETPFILTASWFVCRFLIRKLGLPGTHAARITMGASAFILLLAAETLLGLYGFGRTLDELTAQYDAPAGVIGLAGQVVFALFPAAQIFFERRR